MSGIAGIFYRNSRTVDAQSLAAMAKALQHRGGDGGGTCHDGPVGLVHCALPDTPESVLETQPAWSRSARFLLVFAGRLDNRQQLYELIGWDRPLSSLGDGAIALAAYEKWRNDCASRLLGDFAFAVWDKIEGKLFCARDRFGAKPFYYFIDGRVFVFASEIGALRALPLVPLRVNEQRVGDFFSGVVLDHTSTFFADISRLAPAHFLEVSPQRERVGRYYQLAPRALSCRSDGEYEEAFREIFTRAVRSRLRAVSPVGVSLSGGLDSSSICAVAASLCKTELSGSLETFSGVFEKLKECDERQYFLETVQRYGLISNQLQVDSIDPSVSLETLMQEEDEPFWAPHGFMNFHLLDMMRARGVSVLLDGHDGDAAISYGYNTINDFALSLDLRGFGEFLRSNNVPRGRATVKRILLTYWSIFCNDSTWAWICSGRRRELAEQLTLLDKDFARRLSVEERLREQSTLLPNASQREMEYHRKNLTQPVHSYALEFMERVAARKGVAVRFPFFDTDLVEFTLGLPGSLKLRRGLNRYIVRSSLKAFLPETIIQRKLKTDFTPSLLHAFTVNDRGWLKERIGELCVSRPDYVNHDSLAMLYDVLRAGGKALTLRHIVNALCLVTFFAWKEQRFSQ